MIAMTHSRPIRHIHGPGATSANLRAIELAEYSAWIRIRGYNAYYGGNNSDWSHSREGIKDEPINKYMMRRN
jgi:hypothetical protein